MSYVPQQSIDVLPNYCVSSAGCISLDEARRGAALFTDEPLVQDDSGAWQVSFVQDRCSVHIKWQDMQLKITTSGTLLCSVPQWYP